VNNQTPRQGITTAFGAAVLLVVLAVVVGITLAGGGDDPARRRAVALAASVAGGGALAGWFASRLSRGKAAATAMAGGLGATLLRLGPMLAALGWITSQGGELKDAGAGGLLVAFYLPLLAADILLTLLAGPGGRRNGGVNGVN